MGAMSFLVFEDQHESADNIIFCPWLSVNHARRCHYDDDGGRDG